jgi:hypothetical protein
LNSISLLGCYRVTLFLSFRTCWSDSQRRLASRCGIQSFFLWIPVYTGMTKEKSVKKCYRQATIFSLKECFTECGRFKRIGKNSIKILLWFMCKSSSNLYRRIRIKGVCSHGKRKEIRIGVLQMLHIS